MAGESGAGKSVLSHALTDVLRGEGRSVRVVAQDDYFHLPPAENHARRLDDLGWVGPQEVDLERLRAELASFLSGGPQDFLIAEGTYVLRLPVRATRVFIDVTHEQTLAGRLERARDPIDPDWTPRILAIEQPLIRADRPRADVVLDAQWRPKSASTKPGEA